MDDPTKDLRFVSAADPALDWTVSKVYEYAATRNAELIKPLPGMRPAWWHVRPLDVDQWTAVEEAGGTSRKLIQCVMFALVGIDLGDGTTWRPSRTVQTATGRDVVVCSQEEMQKLFDDYGGQRLYEIGGVVYERAAVGKARSGGARFTLPQSLLEELAAIGHQHAARIRGESETATSPTSSPTPPSS